MGKKLALLISLLFVIVALHTVLQIALFGTGVSGVLESGISGLSIGKISVDRDIKPQYKSLSTTSLVILASEWAFLIILFISAIIKHKKEVHEDMKDNIKIQKYKEKTKTDLDILYDVLKEKKHLKLSTITKIFNVSKEVALNWAKTLEAANLAALHYPRVGEPELALNE